MPDLVTSICGLWVCPETLKQIVSLPWLMIVLRQLCPHQSVWSWSLMNEFERSQECNEYNILINIPFSYLTFGAPSFHYQIEFPAKWERVNGCAIHSQFSVDETSVASFWTVCTFYISTVCTFYNFTVGMFCISTVCALCHPEHYLMPGLKWTK